MLDQAEETRIIKKVVQRLQKPSIEPDNITNVVDFHTHNGIDSPQINYKDLLGATVSYNQVSGTPAFSSTDLSLDDWTFNGTFSSTDFTNTLSWTSGTFKTSDGTSYSISAGGTGSITSGNISYVYFDSATSLTVFQTTTTYSTAVGLGKKLIGIAKPGNVAQGSSIFTDNFNSYTNGSLDTQGSWATAGSSAGWQVESSITNEGARAISRLSTAGLNTTKTGTSVNDGIITFYVRYTSTAGVEGGGAFELYEGGTAGTRIVRVNIANASANDSIRYLDSTATNVTISSGLSASTWYAVQIQWRSSDHKVRYNVNGGTWTSYVAAASGHVWVAGIDTVNIVSVNQVGETIYFDTIQAGLLLGNCTFQIFGGSGGIQIDSANVSNFNQLSDISANLGTIVLGSLSGITVSSGDITGLTTLAIRDTSAAFDVTLAATSSTTLTAGRKLTIDMGNVAHTLAFGTTTGTLTFPVGTKTIPSTADNLSVFAATTSLQFLGVISDETGTGKVTFATAPTFVTSINLTAADIITDASTGTKIGTGTTQKLGFWNATPVAQNTGWSVTNVTTDRVYDADSTTLDEIADVLGTLINQLKTYGVIGA